MNYIIRDKSIITGKKNLEALYTFKNYPVFFGCVNTNPQEDIRADMNWAICPESGVVQLDKLIPLDILYQSQHVDGTGPTWAKYYKKLSEYIQREKPKSILEIGGGTGKLADNFINSTKETMWTIVEPNPERQSTDRVRIIASMFDDKFEFNEQVDTVVFSQVLEHAHNPRKFFQHISDYLPENGSLVFAYPQLEQWLKNKFTNAINFEHTMLLTDYFVDYLLSITGFKIVDKTFYENHSAFYTTKKDSSVKPIAFESKYTEYKKIFNDYIEYYQNLVYDLNKKMNDYDGEIFLFGAHIFSQHLLQVGLKESKITFLLDNSDLKKGKRLYGSSLTVKDPEFIKDANKPVVILKAGIYQEEIRKQLLDLNSNVLIWE